MRNLFLIATILFCLNCSGQQTYSVQVFSIVDSLPIPGNYIRIDNKKLIQSDSNGVFTFTTAKRNVRLTIEPSTIHRVDTVISTKSVSSLIRLYTSMPIDSSLALFDIKNGRARLFCGGGYAPLAPMPSDKDFEMKYSVKYLLLDCLMPSVTELNSYNKIISEYLDKKFGETWRQSVRPDVFYVTRKASR